MYGTCAETPTQLGYKVYMLGENRMLFQMFVWENTLCTVTPSLAQLHSETREVTGVIQ